MGIKERRERDRAGRREAIMTSARKIAAREGWAGVTIRRIADAIEYSPPTIYEYFESKEAILIALIHKILAELRDALRAARTSTSDPEETLFKVARAYADVAWRYPELYHMNFTLEGLPQDTHTRLGDAQQVRVELQLVIEAAKRHRGAPVRDGDPAWELVWAAIHGVTHLALLGRLAGGRARADRDVDLIVRTFLDAWSAEGAAPARRTPRARSA